MQICCDNFRAAMQRGTDCEGYGRLIQWHVGLIPHLGCGLEPIRFCPWCGKEISPIDELPGDKEKQTDATTKTSKEGGTVGTAP